MNWGQAVEVVSLRQFCWAWEREKKSSSEVGKGFISVSKCKFVQKEKVKVTLLTLFQKKGKPNLIQYKTFSTPVMTFDNPLPIRTVQPSRVPWKGLAAASL